jgi:hypothetical protein
MWMSIVLPLLAVTVAPLLAVLAYSNIRTAGGRRYFTAFDERDRNPPPEAGDCRRYQGPAHVVSRFMDLLGYAWPLLRVYLWRAISPTFREKIMIVTATANDCPQ